MLMMDVSPKQPIRADRDAIASGLRTQEESLKKYPFGTALLLRAHRVTGIGVHQLYGVGLVRALVTLLDRLDGRPDK